jgi:hypothetical protein
MKFTIILFLLCGLFCYGQSGLVVADKMTREPIENSNVKLYKTDEVESVITRTDAQGKFIYSPEITNLIKVYHLGYQTKIFKGDTDIDTLFLSPKTNQLDKIEIETENIDAEEIQNYKKNSFVARLFGFGKGQNRYNCFLFPNYEYLTFYDPKKANINKKIVQVSFNTKTNESKLKEKRDLENVDFKLKLSVYDSLKNVIYTKLQNFNYDQINENITFKLNKIVDLSENGLYFSVTPISITGINIKSHSKTLSKFSNILFLSFEDDRPKTFIDNLNKKGVHWIPLERNNFSWPQPHAVYFNDKGSKFTIGDNHNLQIFLTVLEIDD